MFDPVLFVSLGPGDPELVTLKALKALQNADVVFCPATRNKSGEFISRAAEILSSLDINPDKIYRFDVPMLPHRAAAQEAYRKAASEIITLHQAHQKIAVAAEGDAGFYSTIDYISDDLAVAGIPLSRIAGVSAFIACGALAGISITRQNDALEVIPGTVSFPELKEKLSMGKTLVVMKASRCEEVLKQALTMLDDTDFHYFENAGVSGREFYTCRKEEISVRTFPYFSLFIIQKKPI